MAALPAEIEASGNATRVASGTLASAATPNLVPHPTFDADSDGDGVPDGWYVDTPRAALRPVFGLDRRVRRSGRWAATARGGGNPLCFGKWGQVVPVVAGHHYRVSVVFRYDGIEAVNTNLLLALVWQLPGETSRRSPTDHVERFRLLPDGWTEGYGTFRAPDGCASLDVELYFRFAPHGTAWWGLAPRRGSRRAGAPAGHARSREVAPPKPEHR